MICDQDISLCVCASSSFLFSPYRDMRPHGSAVTRFNLLENDFFYLDAHCHLQYFTEDELSILLKKCKDNYFKYFLTNSTSNLDFNQTLNLSKINLNNQKIIPGIGYHPW